MHVLDIRKIQRAGLLVPDRSFGWPGCPDILGQLRDGRFLGVEVKAAKGRASPEQVAFLERIRGAGGVGFIARDLRDVVQALGPL